MANNALTIGRVANESGLTPKAIRLYERKGLIEEPKRTYSGYRIYQAEDIAFLKFIRQAKLLGLSLDEVKQIIDLHRSGGKLCSTVLKLLDERIAEIDHKISELKSLRRTLAAARTYTSKEQQRGKEAVICQLIEQPH